MEWNEYIQKAKRTDKNLKPHKLDIARLTLGIVGEITEFYLEPSVDEAGDIIWYTAILAHKLNLNISPSTNDDLNTAAGKLAEQIKKFIEKDKPLNINHHLNDIIGQTIKLANADLNTILQFNINKLENRHLKRSIP